MGGYPKKRVMSQIHPSLHHLAAREWTEPHLHGSNLVYPLFVTRLTEDKLIPQFGPNKQWGAGPDGKSYLTLVEYLLTLQSKGLRSVMLFGVVTDKDEHGSSAEKLDTPVIVACGAIRSALPEMMVMCDVCLCEYTDHGHCGVLRTIDGEDAINNIESCSRLAQVAVAYANAGAHWVCPSDMMDGRIAAIRTALNKNGFDHVGILAYTSKKASVMYAPFRAAVDSTFTGDRKRYQQPVGSVVHARRALTRDLSEGADAVLVKPSLFYGDIVKSVSENAQVPVACYVVSGEYVMLLDYAKRTNDLPSILHESHVGLLRAGASILITYFTPELLDLIPQWA